MSTSKVLTPPHSHIKAKSALKGWGAPTLKYTEENTDYFLRSAVITHAPIQDVHLITSWCGILLATFVQVPEVYLAGIVGTVDDESLELFVDHVDHGGEGKLPGEGSLGQLAVLVGKDLRHALKLLISVDFKLVVVIISENIAGEKIFLLMLNYLVKAVKHAT